MNNSTLRTDISRNGAVKYTIPPNSLYKSYLPNILGRIHLSQSQRVMDTDEFPHAVVAKALPIQEPYTMAGDNTALERRRYGTPARYLRIGTHAFPFWTLSWLPRGMVLSLLCKRPQDSNPPPHAH